MITSTFECFLNLEKLKESDELKEVAISDKSTFQTLTLASPLDVA